MSLCFLTKAVPNKWMISYKLSVY
ncbi:hypothetical protein CGLO_14646 [Colletotrichum gloeosporioides Cg-14]|uniref:Uncharacterized protein n=1 Tax=Colletotrichum gloeosporioides (strain Cg-14) TaxID=1237896 RepID=T0LD95_COLGC|nr:hypothetical protein CGLO_14646 [Colletotrichum gloeosporioides Cg-14]